MKLKSVLAGFLIGIGGIAYLSLANHIVGAVLFSFGLVTIISRGYDLYTGKIGYATPKDTTSMFLMLLGNFIGVILIGILAININLSADEICIGKLSKGCFVVFLQAILCGFLMYLGVDTTKKTNNPLYAMMAVVIFILTGSEHCVANMFYFTVYNNWSWQIVWFMVVNILGNSIGSILLYRLEKE